MSEHFNELTPREAELLALLAEECGEVVQAIGKILRHGLESRHPGGGPTNREALAVELSHIQAASTLLDQANVLPSGLVATGCEQKLGNVRRYLHHQAAPESEPAFHLSNPYRPAAPEPAPIKCQNCQQKVSGEFEHWHFGYHDDNCTVEPHFICEPAQPEPAIISQSTTDANEPPKSETRTAGGSMLAAPGEMPRAVRRSVRYLRAHAEHLWKNGSGASAMRAGLIAEALESWCRTHATHPVAVGDLAAGEARAYLRGFTAGEYSARQHAAQPPGITEGLEHVLRLAVELQKILASGGDTGEARRALSSIAAVRAQYTSAKPSERPKLKTARELYGS